MVIVFGGTTEGRKAVGVLEEAAKPFYYSTKTGAQDVALHHGVALSGGMSAERMVACCREHGIRLIVDAAHPFAEDLHRNIAAAARELHLPVVRYERTYPPRDPALIWCDGYDDAVAQLERHHIDRLLALTGVNTIDKLRAYWTRHDDSWFRILHREDSQDVARRHGFPAARLVYFDHDGDNTSTLIARLHPQAIITKESGVSGGFAEKVMAARSAGLKVFVVKRPEMPFSHIHVATVNGPHGLRRSVEKLLPGFFSLRTGLTTGTCATAATVAAAQCLLFGVALPTVEVTLPDGETLTVDVGYEPPSSSACSARACGASHATAYCIKDFSDDPDVTRGVRISARVALAADRPTGIRFVQGEGVGRVTLPGLGIAVGEPAINATPRRCITQSLQALTSAPLDVTISVDGGRLLAEKTFNPRVGVVDGISIIGTSGIVRPLSNEAFVESIGREMEVARAMGCTSIGLASGKLGEQSLLNAYPSLRVIHYGNFIGAALARAHALGFQRAVVGILIGKAVKLAEGHLDTHSHKVTLNRDFLVSVATSAGIENAASLIGGITMARELWELMPPAFFSALRQHCYDHCRKVFPTGELEILIHNV